MIGHTFYYITVLCTMLNKTQEQMIIKNIPYIRKLLYKLRNEKFKKLQDEDLEDILQNICLKLLDKGIVQFAGKCKFESYLFIIVRNCTLEYIRKNKKEKTLQNLVNTDSDETNNEQYTELLDKLSPLHIDYTDEIEFQEIIEIINQTIRSFDTNDKLIYEWYFIKNLTQVEVAKMVKLSQPSVAERITKIKKLLQIAILRKYPEITKELQQ